MVRKLFVLPVSVALVAVAAFEGYGAYTRHKPVHYSRGGEFAAEAHSEVATARSPSAAAHPTARPSPSRAEGSSTPSNAPAAEPVAVGQAAPDRPRAALPGRARRSPTATVPRTGTYALDVQGSESVRFGAVSFCSQQLPTRTSLVVSKAAGEAAGSYNADVRYFPDRAGQHDERHIYRYGPKGVFLEYENATVTCQGVRQSTEVSFDPAQLRVQLPLRVGSRWSTSGGDGARTEKGTSTVEATDLLRVGGEQVTTYRITTHIDISGDESGSRDQVWWYAPSWSLPVKWSERIDASRSGASYREDVTVTVLSRP